MIRCGECETLYPAVCPVCHGAGHDDAGDTCGTCGGTAGTCPACGVGRNALALPGYERRECAKCATPLLALDGEYCPACEYLMNVRYAAMGV